MSTNTSTQPLAARDRPKHSLQDQDQEAAQAQPPTASPLVAPAGDADDVSAGTDRSVSVWTMLLFIAGCALLVLAAINLPNLARWGDEHGNVLVFLCFFLVMSIGGRWFWAGIDALWGAVRHKDDA